MESINNEVKNTENFNNLPLEQLEFVAIDIETTGLNSEWDEIIQIAGIRFKGEEVVNQFVSLVKPKGKVPKFIEHLTHISPQ
ncbi:MAG TPA: 3'-5' exonuclease, partial [Candidatus Cloacimonas sp.]|nr:3'-5' exonuclease [Candidatus Cloacimonas sp.]